MAIRNRIVTAISPAERKKLRKHKPDSHPDAKLVTIHDVRRRAGVQPSVTRMVELLSQARSLLSGIAHSDGEDEEAFTRLIEQIDDVLGDAP